VIENRRQLRQHVALQPPHLRGAPGCGISSKTNTAAASTESRLLNGRGCSAQQRSGSDAQHTGVLDGSVEFSSMHRTRSSHANAVPHAVWTLRRERSHVVCEQSADMKTPHRTGHTCLGVVWLTLLQDILDTLVLQDTLEVLTVRANAMCAVSGMDGLYWCHRTP
jgi:hypothetical protein